MSPGSNPHHSPTTTPHVPAAHDADLDAENLAAKWDPLSSAHPTNRIIGHSPCIHAIREQIRHLAAFDTIGNPYVPTLLLQGETGTGKGLVARVIHDSGPRAPGPFIDINCAAIPETLLEAEFFGFKAGAFTDAKRAKPGLFEAASGGTLFLDEIEALPLSLQAKLLTAIDAKRIRPLGAVADHSIDVKLIAATQADLHRAVGAGCFRADLYHRLAVVPLALPPLRERGDDILVLARHFLGRYADVHDTSSKRLSPAAQVWLLRYDWPGNIRELSHLMERVTLLSPEAILGPEALAQLCLSPPRCSSPLALAPAGDDGTSRDEPSRIQQALMQAEGNVVRAARLLGLSRSAMRHRMQRYGIQRPSARTTLIPHDAQRQRSISRAQKSLDRSLSRPPPAEGHDWQQRPIAVLAILLTFPTAEAPEVPRNEPWAPSARWEQIIAEKVRDFGGILLPHAPSLLTAAFGIPRAAAQLPQRVVQTALAIRDLLAEAKVSARGEPCPDVRLAVHLGTVLVDAHASNPTERLLAVGETLALPVWMLGHAGGGEIILSSRVARLIEGIFELEPRQLVQGVGHPDHLWAYAIVGQGTGREFSRFVGKTPELTVLHDLVAQAEEGW